MGTELFDPLGTYQYDIAAACSGIRSLLAIFFFATVYGFVVFRSPWKRLLMIALAVPFAVLGNLLRMLLIIIAAVMGGQEWGNYVHESTLISLVPYLPAFLGLLFIGRYLEEKTSRLESKQHERRKMADFCHCAGAVGGGAGALTWLKKNQKLGVPGIKATPIPGSIKDAF